ncbi:hypothetical protein Q31b_36620 [Novipirellula aureliae]|uniref:Sulfatase n=1 Tax=Novipirellula aureliae TaxID=2527966 RepID=A0A5C6DVP7_9BACT|nr:hypothetical protein [Novipirellula aureliae]TWU40314.1 hypothetical protein Q31b_36620 [Novipirellula aureliae]
MKNPHRKLIVLSFEGLATASLGCFGSSWNQTPGIDSLAATGSVWDRMIANHSNPNEVLRQWFTESGSRSWIEAWQTMGSVDLITDKPEIPKLQLDVNFDKTVLVGLTPPSVQDRACEEIEETHLAKLFAALLDHLESSSDASVTWMHSQALALAWDAPRWLVPQDEDGYELEPPSDTPDLLGDDCDELTDAGPAAPAWCFDEATPPFYAITKNDHPDQVVSWMRTYACQIQLIDRMIDLLAEATEENGATIVVVGASGFSLGQNGWVGHRAGPLRTCHHHLPLIIRRAASTRVESSCHGPMRTSQATVSSELNRLLIELAESDNALISPSAWGQSQSEFEPQIVTAGEEGEVAITTPHWYMVRQSDGETPLFFKPDDIQDHNNVARIRNDIVERLEESL